MRSLVEYIEHGAFFSFRNFLTFSIELRRNDLNRSHERRHFPKKIILSIVSTVRISAVHLRRPADETATADTTDESSLVSFFYLLTAG